MVSGHPLGSQDAIKIGLADEMVDNADDLEQTMREWILDANAKTYPYPAGNHAKRRSTAAARDKYLKRVRADHTPAPAAIIDCWKFWP